MTAQSTLLSSAQARYLAHSFSDDTLPLEADLMERLMQIPVGSGACYTAKNSDAYLIIARYQEDRFEVHYFEPEQPRKPLKHFTVMADGTVPWSSLTFVSTPSGFLRACFEILIQRDIQSLSQLESLSREKQKPSRKASHCHVCRTNRKQRLINTTVANLQVSHGVMQVLQQVEPGTEREILNLGKVKRFLNGKYEVYWKNSSMHSFGNLITQLSSSGMLLCARFGIPGNYLPYSIEATMKAIRQNLKAYRQASQSCTLV